MNEPIEDRLRTMLSATALREVPDSTVIPLRRTGDELGRVRARRVRPWLAPALTGLAAAVIAVVATVIVVTNTGRGHNATPQPSPVAGTAVRPTAAASSRPTESSSSHPSAVTTSRPTATTSPRVVLVSVTVPKDLTGKSYDEAAQELTRMGLAPTKQVVDGTAPVDTVLGVAGATAGGPVPTGSTVTLRVSNNQLFVVPNLSNLTPDAAAVQLTELGWNGNVTTLDERRSETEDSTLIGLIAGGETGVLDQNQKLVRTAAQTPATGVTARKTANITVVVYTKKSLPVPSFKPEVTLYTDIQAQMYSAGFTNVTYKIVTPAMAPNVPFTFIELTGATAGDEVAFDTPLSIAVWGSAPPPATPTTPAAATTPTTPTTPPTPTKPATPTTTK